MTLAVAKAVTDFQKDQKRKPAKAAYDKLSNLTIKYMQEIGRKYPNCGYGGRFYAWMFSDDPQPYASCGFSYALHPGEIKYCGVEFSENDKTFYFRTTNLRIETGDDVIVPVGDSNIEKEGTVVCMEFCRWYSTPYPLEKTKEIIRLVSDPVKTPYQKELSSAYYEDDEYEDEE